MQLTEEMILDVIDNVLDRDEIQDLSIHERGLIAIACAQVGVELRRKLND